MRRFDGKRRNRRNVAGHRHLGRRNQSDKAALREHTLGGRAKMHKPDRAPADPRIRPAKLGPPALTLHLEDASFSEGHGPGKARVDAQALYTCAGALRLEFATFTAIHTRCPMSEALAQVDPRAAARGPEGGGRQTTDTDGGRRTTDGGRAHERGVSAGGAHGARTAWQRSRAAL